MSKVLNTLILGLALFLGGNYLWATTYPSSSGGADLGTANIWTADQTYNDSVNITLGTGGDVDLSFVTPNLVLDTQVAGTGHFIIQEGTVGTTNGADTGTLNLNTTDAGARGPQIILQHNSATPANNDDIVIIAGIADDSGSTSRNVALMEWRFLDVTSTTMDSEMRFGVMNNVNAAGQNTTATLSSLGAWTDTSGASSKEYEGQPQDIYGGRILDKLDNLFVSRYHTVGETDIKERHISPTAEDLWDSFGVGSDPRVLDQDTDGDGVMDTPTPGIAAKDLGGIALAAIQELHQKIKALEAEFSKRGSAYLPPQANPGPPMP